MGGRRVRKESGWTMNLEVLAIAAAGVFLAVKTFITLVDCHYHSALDLRRQRNQMRLKAEEKIREKIEMAGL